MSGVAREDTGKHDFDEFMSRLPQWAQSHVYELKRQIAELQRALEARDAELAKEGEGATIWVTGQYPHPDRPINGGEEAYPGARDHMTIRFGKSDRSWDGIRINWTDRVRNGDWLELNAGSSIEIRSNAANSIYVREVER